MQGWIKLYREVLETDLWYDVTTFRLFTYLLLNATHQDGIKKGGVELKRGQWIRSYRKLAQDLAYKEGRGVKEYSIKTISKCVKKLVDVGTITVEETKQGTLFTIVNYAKYQDKQEFKKETGNASGNEVETNGERSGNNNKNGNNGENVNNVVVDNDTDGNFERAIIDRYMQLAGIGGFDIPEWDKPAVREVINAGIPIETVLSLLDQCFKEYQPKHPRDKINSFKYCATYIMAKYYQKKEGANNVLSINRGSYGRTKSQNQPKPEPILGEDFVGRVRRNRA